MREIKFRAWDKENKCWYAPTHEAYRGNLFELLVGFGGDLSAHTMEGLERQSLWPDRFELMQYTGLLDKNGVEIYEGDLLQWHPKEKAVKVDWGKSGFVCSTVDLHIGNDHAEVIGNIYENPELLKGEK